MPLNPRLWTVLKAAASCDWVKSLSPVRQRFIQETLADFRESGADLPDDVKPEYAEIEAQLSLKTKKFAENVLDSTNAWELIVEDEAELSGLPDSAKEAARLDALANPPACHAVCGLGQPAPPHVGGLLFHREGRRIR